MQESRQLNEKKGNEIHKKKKDWEKNSLGPDKRRQGLLVH